MSERGLGFWDVGGEQALRIEEIPSTGRGDDKTPLAITEKKSGECTPAGKKKKKVSPGRLVFSRVPNGCRGEASA